MIEASGRPYSREIDIKSHLLNIPPYLHMHRFPVPVGKNEINKHLRLFEARLSSAKNNPINFARGVTRNVKIDVIIVEKKALDPST